MHGECQAQWLMEPRRENICNYAELVTLLGPMVKIEREVPFIGETTGANVFLKADFFFPHISRSKTICLERNNELC